MIRSTKLKIVLVFLVLCLPIIACQGSSPAEPTIAVELTPTIVPTPTLDPWSFDRIPVTLIGQITGTWSTETATGDYYIRIHTDGTFMISTTLEALNTGSMHSWRIWIEKSLLFADGYNLCSGEIGSYFAGIGSDGTLKFTTIHDPCPYRIPLMDKSLPAGLGGEIDLIYTRVE